MHHEFKREFGFPDQYVENLYSLADRLSDVDIPDESGTVVALEHFDNVTAEPEILLDVLARCSRNWMLFGRRFIVLVQTSDPDYRGPLDLAATPAQWNGREWMTASRKTDQ
jgi:RNAse (barnase) inhibitor barstar